MTDCFFFLQSFVNSINFCFVISNLLIQCNVASFTIFNLLVKFSFNLIICLNTIFYFLTKTYFCLISCSLGFGCCFLSGICSFLCILSLLINCVNSSVKRIFSFNTVYFLLSKAHFCLISCSLSIVCSCLSFSCCCLGIASILCCFLCLTINCF